MVRTISVVFTDRRLSVTNFLKRYKFLCSYNQVKVGDMIVDARYSNKMQVVDISYCTSAVQDGFTLKDIIIDELNGQKVCKGSDYDIDKTRRSISITIEQAMEWYNSGNTTLRTLALNAYTKDELELNYKMIESSVDQTCGCFNTPMCEQKKFQVLAKLAIIAKYYNKRWKRTTCNIGYFLGNRSTANGPIVDTCNGVGVYQHNTVQYAGVIYFKNPEDAIKAVKILGDEVKELFK